MYLRSRDYSYPVLGDGTGSFVSGSFSTQYKLSFEFEEVIISLKPVLDNPELERLINEGYVDVVYHLECARTSFRKIKKTTLQEQTIRVRRGFLNDKFEICSFLVAKQTIPSYSNDAFSSDYKGFTFQIDKGCILAIGTSVESRIEDKRDSLRNTSSIFLIVEDKSNPDRKDMSIDLFEEKIVVYTSAKVKAIYDNMKGIVALQKTFHSLIVLPALVSVFQQMSKSEERFNYESKRWYRSLMKVLKEINIDETNLESQDAFTLAQRVLGNPVYYSITEEIGSGNGGDDYEA